MGRTTVRLIQYALTLLVGLFMVVPVVMSILAGVTQNFFVGLKSGLTLHWVGEVWRLYSETIALSMLIAICCVALTLAIGVPCAYVLAKRPGRIARAVEEVLTLPVAIPGLALALALIITWGGFRDFRTSWAFILVGHVLYTLPFMTRSVLSVLAASEMRDLEEGAASLGAGFWTRLVTVVLPNAKGGILAGALMVLTLSVGEFNLTWMLHTPETKTLPVGLADSYASMRLEIASAYTLVFFVMIVPLLVAMQAMSRTRRRAAHPEEEPLPCAPTPQPSN
jgi:putative spermidine/putrescine transport system permease protein